MRPQGIQCTAWNMPGETSGRLSYHDFGQRQADIGRTILVGNRQGNWFQGFPRRFGNKSTSVFGIVRLSIGRMSFVSNSCLIVLITLMADEAIIHHHSTADNLAFIVKWRGESEFTTTILSNREKRNLVDLSCRRARKTWLLNHLLMMPEMLDLSSLYRMDDMTIVTLSFPMIPRPSRGTGDRGGVIMAGLTSVLGLKILCKVCVVQLLQ